MSARLNELPPATSVVLITFGDSDRLDEYSRTSSYDFPILVDPDRRAYRSYGLGRTSLQRVWGLRAARRYYELFRTEGIKPIRGATDDTRQLGGDFVIASDGRLAYGFWGEGPDDRPTVDALIAAAAGTGR